MPLPMPRWVISSPSHITERGAGRPGQDDQGGFERREVGDQRRAGAELSAGLTQQPALAVLQHEQECGRLQEHERDGEVTRPLRDLLLPGLALVLPFFELRDHDAEQLHDDRRRDVRHDPEREDRRAREGASREQVEKADRAVRRVLLQVPDRVEVDVRRGDVRPEPEHEDDADREQDLLPKVRNAEHVSQA